MSAPSSSVVPNARLVSLADGREYAVEVLPFVIGRDPGAHVRLDSEAVASRHAELVAAPGGHALVDLGEHGVLVNGRRISAPVVLRKGDVVRVGDSEFRYHVAEFAAPPTGAQSRLGDTVVGMPALRRPPSMPVEAPPVPAEPLATLLVKRGQRKGELLPVRWTVARIGRGDDNEIALPDASISADHAKLQLKEGVWVLTDLGSTNGSRVNGQAVKGEVTLSPGAELGFGDVILLFNPPGESRRSRTALLVLGAAVLLVVAYLLVG